MLKNKDVNLIIMMELDDKSLFNFCQINKYGKKLCLNEDFWRNRLWKYYGKIYPTEGQKWKEFYLKLVYYIDKYKYEKDDDSFQRVCEAGHLELVKYLISTGLVNPSGGDNYAIRVASANGHLEVIKYLMSTGLVDPSSKDNFAIGTASYNGNLEVVKYLMSIDGGYNIDPSVYDNYPIRWAGENGHLEVVKYLLSLPKEYGVKL